MSYDQLLNSVWPSACLLSPGWCVCRLVKKYTGMQFTGNDSPPTRFCVPDKDVAEFEKAVASVLTVPPPLDPSPSPAPTPPPRPRFEPEPEPEPWGSKGQPGPSDSEANRLAAMMDEATGIVPSFNQVNDISRHDAAMGEREEAAVEAERAMAPGDRLQMHRPKPSYAWQELDGRDTGMSLARGAVGTAGAYGEGQPGMVEIGQGLQEVAPAGLDITFHRPGPLGLIFVEQRLDNDRRGMGGREPRVEVGGRASANANAPMLCLLVKRIVRNTEAAEWVETVPIPQTQGRRIADPMEYLPPTTQEGCMHGAIGSSAASHGNRVGTGPAGVRPGLILERVDGLLVVGCSYEEVASMIGGSPKERSSIERGAFVRALAADRPRRPITLTFVETLRMPDPGLFGIRLQAVLDLDRARIPGLVSSCICFLEQRGIFEPELFSEKKEREVDEQEVAALRSCFEYEHTYTIPTESYSPHTVAALLLRWLRKLPIPPLGGLLYEGLLQLGQVATTPALAAGVFRALHVRPQHPAEGDAAGVEKATLPMLQRLFGYWHAMACHALANGMGSRQLAACLTPVLTGLAVLEHALPLARVVQAIVEQPALLEPPPGQHDANHAEVQPSTETELRSGQAAAVSAPVVTYDGLQRGVDTRPASAEAEYRIHPHPPLTKQMAIPSYLEQQPEREVQLSTTNRAGAMLSEKEKRGNDEDLSLLPTGLRAALARQWAGTSGDTTAMPAPGLGVSQLMARLYGDVPLVYRHPHPYDDLGLDGRPTLKTVTKPPPPPEQAHQPARVRSGRAVADGRRSAASATSGPHSYHARPLGMAAARAQLLEWENAQQRGTSQASSTSKPSSAQHMEWSSAALLPRSSTSAQPMERSSAALLPSGCQETFHGGSYRSHREPISAERLLEVQKQFMQLRQQSVPRTYTY